MLDVRQVIELLKKNPEGIDLWVYSFARNSILEKAIRSIKPTKVKIEFKYNATIKNQHSRYLDSYIDNIISIFQYTKDGKKLLSKPLYFHKELVYLIIFFYLLCIGKLK